MNKSRRKEYKNLCGVSNVHSFFFNFGKKEKVAENAV